jgi:hypothetical protein
VISRKAKPSNWWLISLPKEIFYGIAECFALRQLSLEELKLYV